MTQPLTSVTHSEQAPALSHTAQRRLAGYLAAGAGALAMGGAGFADAAVIFTPGPFNTGPGGTVPIDFNGDSAAEFNIFHTFTYSPPVFAKFYLGLSAGPGASNQAHVEGIPAYSPRDDTDPAALPPGFFVGPGAPFNNENPDTLGSFVFPPGSSDGNFTPFDPPRFIGVRFDLSGNTHYGWIELQLQSGATGTILGYAYESTPDTGIRTGQTTSAIPEPPSLLLLASGAAGLAALRRRRRPANA